MLVTLLGMMTEVRRVQLLKAELPIFVTLLGMVMEDRFVNLANAKSSMLVTFLGITKSTISVSSSL